MALLVTSNVNNNKPSPSFGAQLKTTPVVEKSKEKLIDQLSMSVPKNKKQNDLLKEAHKNNSNSVTANFCFSGASGIKYFHLKFFFNFNQLEHSYLLE